MRKVTGTKGDKPQGPRTIWRPLGGRRQLLGGVLVEMLAVSQKILESSQDFEKGEGNKARD